MKKNEVSEAFYRIRCHRGNKGSLGDETGVSNHMKLGILHMNSVILKILKPLMKSYFALVNHEYMQEKLKETMSKSRICLRKSKKFTGMSDDGNQSEMVPISDRVNIGQILLQSANVDIRSLPDEEFCPFTPLFTTRNYGTLDHHAISKTQEAQVVLPRNNSERHELSPVRKPQAAKKFDAHKSSLPNLYDSKFRAIEYLSRIDGDSNEVDSRASGRSLLAPPISEIRNLAQLENTELSLHALLERPTALTQKSEVSYLPNTQRNSKDHTQKWAPLKHGSVSASVTTRKQSFNLDNLKHKYGVPSSTLIGDIEEGNSSNPHHVVRNSLPGNLLQSLQQSTTFTTYLKTKGLQSSSTSKKPAAQTDKQKITLIPPVDLGKLAREAKKTTATTVPNKTSKTTTEPSKTERLGKQSLPNALKNMMKTKKAAK